MTTVRAAIYARVSTDGQSTDNQLHALREVANRRGWEVSALYVDQGISGAKGRDQRPEFDRLIGDATRRSFDVIMAWSIDRLGRSVANVAGFLVEMDSVGVALYLHQQAMDTSTPYGKAMLHMATVFAELEREVIRERVKAGLVRAKAQGKTLGRPRIDPGKVKAIHLARSEGLGVNRIARRVGVAPGTVLRVLKAD